MNDLRKAAASFCWMRVFGILQHEPGAKALASEAFSYITFDRHSGVLADAYRDLRDRIVAWCDARECGKCGVRLNSDGDCPSCLMDAAELMESVA